MLMSTLFHNFILTTEKHLLSVFSSNWFFFCVSVCRSGGGRWRRRRLCRSSGLLHKSFSQDHPAVSAHTQIPSPALPHHLHSSLVPLLHPSPLPLSAFPFAGPLISPLFLSLLKHTHAHSLFCSCPYRQFLLSQPSITCVFEGGNHPSSPVRCFFPVFLCLRTVWWVIVSPPFWNVCMDHSGSRENWSYR